MGVESGFGDGGINFKSVVGRGGGEHTQGKRFVCSKSKGWSGRGSETTLEFERTLQSLGLVRERRRKKFASISGPFLAWRAGAGLESRSCFRRAHEEAWPLLRRYWCSWCPKSSSFQRREKRRPQSRCVPGSSSTPRRPRVRRGRRSLLHPSRG